MTRIDAANLSHTNLNRYNTIILPGTGGYSSVDAIGGFDKSATAKLKTWVNEGGTLIALNKASEWAIKNGLSNEKVIPEKIDSSRTHRNDFVEKEEIEGAKAIGGTILQVDVDITHPLGFGFNSRKVAVLKNNSLTLQYAASAYNTVVAFDGNTLSGYISKDNSKRLSKTAALLVSPSKSGRVILFAFDPISRASWFATERLFDNSLFFGQLLTGGSGKYRTYQENQ